MSNTYRINFKELRQENLKGIFESFERAMQVLGIDFYLIGAIARDTWFAQKNIKALGTKDIDFAVLVSDETKYHELKNFLIMNEGFIDSSINEYVLFDRNGYQVDLLPFGALEIEGNKFTDSKGFIRTDLSGFKEVYETAVEEVNFENRFTFKVSSLAGIVVLKFIAFDDRPEMRTKDIHDIGIIINHYFELEAENIYNKHSDLFEEEKSLAQVASRALGREMQLILKRNSLLKERLLSILYKNIESLTDSPIGRILSRVLDSSPQATVQDAVNLLREMTVGIHDNVENIAPGKGGENDFLNEATHFANIVKGDFKLTLLSPIYPPQPHSIFSKNFSQIKLSGESTYQFYIVFFKVTGEMYRKPVKALPGKAQIDYLIQLPLKECQIKFELITEKNHSTDKYCNLSFKLLP